MNTPLHTLPCPGLGVKVPSHRSKRVEAFVHAPIEWVRAAQEAGGAFTVTVALLIWYRRCVTGTNSYTVSNTAASLFGLDRKQKASGLKSLELNNLVRVNRHKGASPTVTINWEPGHKAAR